MEGFKNLFTESVRKGGRKLFPAKQKSINGGGGVTPALQTDSVKWFLKPSLSDWIRVIGDEL